MNYYNSCFLSVTSFKSCLCLKFEKYCDQNCFPLSQLNSKVPHFQQPPSFFFKKEKKNFFCFLFSCFLVTNYLKLIHLRYGVSILFLICSLFFTSVSLCVVAIFIVYIQAYFCFNRSFDKKVHDAMIM